MSEKMEGLMNAIYMDKLPASWIKLSWPSLRPLSGTHTRHHDVKYRIISISCVWKLNEECVY